MVGFHTLGKPGGIENVPSFAMVMEGQSGEDRGGLFWCRLALLPEGSFSTCSPVLWLVPTNGRKHPLLRSFLRWPVKMPALFIWWPGQCPNKLIDAERLRIRLCPLQAIGQTCRVIFLFNFLFGFCKVRPPLKM
jgi:hypothetical protein